MLFYVIISVSTVKEVQDMKKRIAIFSAVLEVLTVFGTACGGRTAAPGVTFGQPTDTKPGTLPPTEQPTSGEGGIPSASAWRRIRARAIRTLIISILQSGSWTTHRRCRALPPKTVSPQRGKWYYGMSVQVFPSDADCRCATWHSENPQVASVNASSGYIYAQSAGTVRIYATATDGSGCRDFVTVTVKDSIPVESVTLNRTSLTLEKGKTATLGVTICPTNATIVVDVRDKVVIKKQGSAFDVLLPSGRIWKSICCDLNDSENRTPNTSLHITYYEYLNVTEKRFVDNFEFGKLYTVQELAFLYRIDPLGMEYLMRNGATDRYSDLGQQLLFKDNVYKAIFGEPMTGRFYFTIENEQVCYGTYRGVNRVSLYSNAEILFGSHNNLTGVIF